MQSKCSTAADSTAGPVCATAIAKAAFERSDVPNGPRARLAYKAHLLSKLRRNDEWRRSGTAVCPIFCQAPTSASDLVCIHCADEVNALVIDLGSSTAKAGYAGDDTPKCYFPSVSLASKGPSAVVLYARECTRHYSELCCSSLEAFQNKPKSSAKPLQTAPITLVCLLGTTLSTWRETTWRCEGLWLHLVKRQNSSCSGSVLQAVAVLGGCVVFVLMSKCSFMGGGFPARSTQRLKVVFGVASLADHID